MVLIENTRRSEAANYIPFFEQLQRLSDSENPIPLKPEHINPRQINEELRQKRICVDIINSRPELQKSIREKQFRGENQGRGPAVLAVLGKSGYGIFFAWAQIDSKDKPMLKYKKKNGKKETPNEREEREKTRCRGETQLMVDIFALASGNMTKEVFCRRTNWRVAMSHKDNPELPKRFGISTDSAEQKKLKHLSSIPIGSPIRVYQKILSLNPKLNELTRASSCKQTRVDLGEIGNYDDATADEVGD